MALARFGALPLASLLVAAQASANSVLNQDLARTYATISDALADAQLAVGHTLVVSPGTYLEAITVDLDITLKSTYETVPAAIHGTILQDQDAVASTVTISAGTLAGFTIQDSFAQAGGGVTASGTAAVIRNIIRNCQANFDGGGVYAYGSARILFNRICDSAPCGVLGSALGGGILAQEDALIMGNLIEDNYGSCDPFCSGGRAAGGGPLLGGGVAAFGRVRVVSNVIRGNCALLDSGVSLFEQAVAVNNTIVANDEGDAATCAAGTTFANNIVAFHAGTGVNGVGADIRNNCYFANGGGDGNTGSGAVLADPALRPDGLHLRPRSPCRDAGSADVIVPEDLDFDGAARVVSGSVDIGADEFSLRALSDDAAKGGAAHPSSEGVIVLSPPLPNPSVGTGGATFRFSLSAAASVRLELYDVAGRLVAERTPETLATAGEHAIHWDPGDLPAGAYWVKLVTAAGGSAGWRWVVLR
jgi:hypothetical protein